MHLWPPRLAVSVFGFLLMTLADSSPILGQGNASYADIGVSDVEFELLESGRRQRDYPCKIQLRRPVLGFDFRFHAGFTVTIPLSRLAGEDQLTLVYRVRSRALQTAPLFYRQPTLVPRGGEEGRNLLLFSGEFATGEGEFVLDLVIRGESGKACAERFGFDSERSRKGRKVPLTLGQGEVDWPAREVGRVWPSSDAARPLRFKVLVNVPPFRNSRKPLTADDAAYLLSFLKYFGERTPLLEVSLTAFNLKEQRVIYRQPARPWLSIVALGRSLADVESEQLISVSSLKKDSVKTFLAKLIEDDVRGADVDGVLFLGPLGYRGESLKELGRELEGQVPPLFYLRYRTRASTPTFGDPIREFVREAGGQSFEIADPYELWEAVEEILEELQKSKGSGT